MCKLYNWNSICFVILNMCISLTPPYPTGCQGCWFRRRQSESSIRSHDCRNWDISVDGSWGIFMGIWRLNMLTVGPGIIPFHSIMLFGTNHRLHPLIYLGFGTRVIETNLQSRAHRTLLACYHLNILAAVILIKLVYCYYQVVIRSTKTSWKFSEINSKLILSSSYSSYFVLKVIEHKPYDHKADVFSFAIVLWELLTGKVQQINGDPPFLPLPAT